MKELKNILLLSFFFLHLVLLAQNPITQETTYQYTNDKTWRKVSTINFDYQGNHLVKETQRTYNNVIADWYISSEKRFDVNNNIVREITKSFISQDAGFYVRNNQFTYSESGQLLLTLLYIKEGDDQPLRLVRRIEYEYLADCSYVERFYQPSNSANGQLAFSQMQLALYDEECRFARFINSDHIDESVEALRNSIRVTYEVLSQGRRRRIVEVAACPFNVANCQEWDIKEQLVFDESNRNIVREIGSRNDFVRTLTTTQYEANQTVYEYRTFIKLNGINQVLTGVEEEILDLAEQPLYRRRAEPFVLDEWNYLYNEDGLIEQEFFERNSKSEEGLQIFLDTTTYQYQFYCDDLTSEIIISNQDGMRRITYSYLYPMNCGTTVTEVLAFNLFPNPANDFITVANEQFVHTTLSISIMDAFGRIVQTQQNYRNVNQSIDIRNIPNGVYFIQLNNQTEVTIKPFIIAR